MSGSGGGSYSGPTVDNCATLSQETTLNSPSETVLKKMKKGDVLTVSTSKIGSAIIIEASYKGEVAGSITSSKMQQIAECIEQGYEYAAEVIEVKGGACKIRVRPK